MGAAAGCGGLGAGGGGGAAARWTFADGIAAVRKVFGRACASAITSSTKELSTASRPGVANHWVWHRAQRTVRPVAPSEGAWIEYDVAQLGQTISIRGREMVFCAPVKRNSPKT
jgi:hypothetical protein